MERDQNEAIGRTDGIHDTSSRPPQQRSRSSTVMPETQRVASHSRPHKSARESEIPIRCLTFELFDETLRRAAPPPSRYAYAILHVPRLGCRQTGTDEPQDCAFGWDAEHEVGR